MNHPTPADAAWRLLLDAAALAESLEQETQEGPAPPRTFGADDTGRLVSVTSSEPGAVLAWDPVRRWQSRLDSVDPRAAFVDLYLPLCSATMSAPMTIGHLGQSLDGFIATHSGDSQFVTGSENLVHMHRLRALCSVVIVGAGTVAADDPQLTTRHVSGESPLRVVFDPTRRLTAAYRLFDDEQAPTLYVCGQSRIATGETHVGRAPIVGFDDRSPEQAVAQLLAMLRGRGHARVFVEGGGVTVSAFLEANLLDRLHIAIAPVLIGDGRPAIRLAPHATLRDCRRPAYRVFRMGGDVLFDCDLRGEVDTTAEDAGCVDRVI